MTAVEWLEIQFDKYTRCGVNVPNDKIFKLTKKAKAMEKEYKSNVIRAIADYMYSEGCSCCEGKDHKDHAEKIAKLLDVPKYEDGSGYNFYQFRNK